MHTITRQNRQKNRFTENAGATIIGRLAETTWRDRVQANATYSKQIPRHLLFE